MQDDYYSVYDADGLIAKDMTLEHALLFLEALFNKYWQESGIRYSIARQMPSGSCLKEKCE